MKILVCGASGFIGQAICKRLAEAGHNIVRGVRRPAHPHEIAIDFATDITVDAWRPRLAGIDAVVNAVGIITERGAARFDTVHHQAPAALFATCAETGVTRVVQISALGAERGSAPYFTSKYAADRALQALPIEWQILRPSLVYGPEGVSASLFLSLASLPWIPVPALGKAAFQPVHIDDLTEAVARAVSPEVAAGQEIELVGPSACSYRDMLVHYRRQLGLAQARFLTIPAALMSQTAKLVGRRPGAMLSPDNWRMLQAGSTGNAAPFTRLLGRPPRGIAAFIPPEQAELLRLRARARWHGTLLRHILAVIWIATALISAFVYPAESSLALLRQVGLDDWPAQLALYGSSLLDLLLGLACLRRPGKALWAMQIALVLGYTVVIALALPEFLTHPFGPLLKNLPILAILFILYDESPSWTT